MNISGGFTALIFPLCSCSLHILEEREWLFEDIIFQVFGSTVPVPARFSVPQIFAVVFLCPLSNHLDVKSVGVWLGLLQRFAGPMPILRLFPSLAPCGHLSGVQKKISGQKPAPSLTVQIASPVERIPEATPDQDYVRALRLERLVHLVVAHAPRRDRKGKRAEGPPPLR